MPRHCPLCSIYINEDVRRKCPEEYLLFTLLGLHVFTMQMNECFPPTLLRFILNIYHHRLWPIFLLYLLSEFIKLFHGWHFFFFLWTNFFFFTILYLIKRVIIVFIIYQQGLYQLTFINKKKLRLKNNLVTYLQNQIIFNGTFSKKNLENFLSPTLGRRNQKSIIFNVCSRFPITYCQTWSVTS